MKINRLSQEYNSLYKHGFINKKIPEYIDENLNQKFKLRPYQTEAIVKFIHYLEKDTNRIKPTQLLFNMATGSGKTLLMAANILYLYAKGYRNFLFFVNSTNIIEKTRDNFLNISSPKYLFNTKIMFDGQEVVIKEVANFDEADKDDINIIFTTIQGLYSQLNLYRENAVTFEDFKEHKIVLISDEAHHINAWTRNKLDKTESELKKTWEYMVDKILNASTGNIMLEYTATIDMVHPAIEKKYRNKIIFEYDLKQFRKEGYSKEVKVLQADLELFERMLLAIILSQYRRKIAGKYGLNLKPVVLFKSKSIKESKQNFELFVEKINGLTQLDVERIKENTYEEVIQNVFEYFDKENISIANFVLELKEAFSEEKCILLDSKNIDKEKQLKLNTLEDENNRIRAIFAVNMLNEGWDVLNLFDIVRLYDTRDAKSGKPGKTTNAEAQLIGRGARYYPFRINEDDEFFKRKFDNQPNNELKIIEDLYYHSKHNPRYIQELTKALKNKGIIPDEEKMVALKVKPEIKKSGFWKNGVIWLNEKVEVDRSNIKNIDDIAVKKVYKYNLVSGFVKTGTVLIDNKQKLGIEKTTKTFLLGNFDERILRKAMQKLDFYRFSNLKKYFPALKSSVEFIVSLKNIAVDITGTREKLQDLDVEDQLKVSIKILKELEHEIKKDYVSYKGTEVFKPFEIKKIVKDKQMKINIDDDSNQTHGVPMSRSLQTKYQLNLKDKKWYVFDENYGTSEEKSFVKFIDGIIDELNKNYIEVYLLRNAGLFKIYRFADAKAMEPDFVLFLKKKNNKRFLQIFIEPKGRHLIKTDQWKEDFLQEIEKQYRIKSGLKLLREKDRFKIIGLPFYNNDRKAQFVEIFKEI